MPKNQTVLVTGGAGFIGSHLVRRLLNEGNTVRVLDDLSTGKKENLEGITSGIELIVGDISQPGELGPVVRGCNMVFHLAAVASVPQTVKEPIRSAEVNEMGTLRVLEASRQAGVKRVVMASSAAVYGDEPGFPKLESMAGRPLSPYAWHKRAGERYGQLYQELYGLETVSLRFFNVFGPRQDPSSPYSGVISIFMDRAMKGAPLTIFGDGGQVRDFIFAGDVARAVCLAMDVPQAAGGIINIGTGIKTTVGQLAQTVGR
jgi:UDP-glucose 4-epimerase